MSIHSNLKLLLENIDNPELFNLYLEDPRDIILNIIKTNKFTLLLRLSMRYMTYRECIFENNKRIPVNFNNDKCKWFIDNLFNNPLNDILTLLLSQLRKPNPYLRSKIIEYKDKVEFNSTQKQFIYDIYPKILNHEYDVTGEIIFDFNTGKWKKVLDEKNNDELFILFITHKSTEYYKKWINELMEYFDILYFERN